MKMKKALLTCILAAPMVASAGQADLWYIAPEIGGISPDYRRQLENQDYLFGVAFGRELNRYFNLELNMEGARLGGKHSPPGGLYTYDATLDALAILNRDGLVSPYLRLGAGVIRNTPTDAPYQTHFGTDAGVGMYLNLWQSADGTAAFALRPEIKVRWDEPGRGQHLHDYIASLGLQYSFGGQPSEASPPPPPPPPPPPAVTHAAPPAAATPVAPAPAMALPKRGSVTLEGVTFAFNSAQLQDGSSSVLDKVAAGLKQHPLIKVEIQGYTDSVGARSYNMRLSRLRARAVRDYLVGQGVASSQMTARGYGPADPVASNRTAAGRAQNRRVVLEVLTNPNDIKVKGQGSTD